MVCLLNPKPYDAHALEKVNACLIDWVNENTAFIDDHGNHCVMHLSSWMAVLREIRENWTAALGDAPSSATFYRAKKGE